MPFGSERAPMTFQRAVDIILSRAGCKTALVYLEDVVTTSKTMTEHRAHVREEPLILQLAGVTLKLAKCNSCDTAASYFRRTSRPGQLETGKQSLVVIKRVRVQRISTDLGLFLGMRDVCRRFVSGFAESAVPLNKKTSAKGNGSSLNFWPVQILKFAGA